MEQIKFKRSVRPIDAVGNPIQEYGTCAYLRWEENNGQFESRLLAAKGEWHHQKNYLLSDWNWTVRWCQRGWGISSRRKQELKLEEEYLIVDSEIVRVMLQKESYGFKKFVALKVGEIQSSTSPSYWAFIEGKHNIADWTTRNKESSEIGEESCWQTGPAQTQFVCQVEKETLKDWIQERGRMASLFVGGRTEKWIQISYKVNYPCFQEIICFRCW